MIQSVRSKALPSNATNETNDDSADIINELFEGTLCSVLICEECGCKRKIPETFLNVSLPLSKHVDDHATGPHERRGSMSKISLQRCLGKFIVEKLMTMYSARPPNCIATFRLAINLTYSWYFVIYLTDHFTAPESLSDPVDCPSCRRKTPTKKQHTFAKLPKVLCLHLKRFDAVTNKKVDDFVRFPASSLDMGRMLPHW
jgi:ubiquitin C-terminal hydrolase